MNDQQNEITSQKVKPQPCQPCAPVPDFARLRYFYGQMLGPCDFQAEQDYFREKLKLHNRCLHGYGTVCGLKVVTEPIEPDCDPQSQGEISKLKAELEQIEQKIIEAKQNIDAKAESEANSRAEEIRRKLEKLRNDLRREEKFPRVLIECGLALDCEGNELVVRQPLPVDLWQELSIDDRKRIDRNKETLYVSLCYCPLPIDPVRPVLIDTCGATSECVYGKVKDSVRVKVTVEPPKADGRCETCCGPCAELCLLLARINDFVPGQSLTEAQIENDVRRMIGPYPFATITGISWTHGAEYTAEEAKSILGTYDEHGGIKIQFSRPVLTETLTKGIVDLWVIEGGRGKAGNISNWEGDYVDLPGPSTTWLKFRQTTRETLQEGDRVLVIVRTCFILDKCCRPVDGNHIGGRVPILHEYKANDRSIMPSVCIAPPLKFGPWTSGNETPGGTFESWIRIKSDDIKP